MKIVSLQSVGLGATFPSRSYEGINEPYVLKVGKKLKDGRGEELDVTVTEINYQQGDFIIKGVHGEIYSCKPDIFEETYVNVNDTDRISPDDNGNDIHEFLHGGDK